MWFLQREVLLTDDNLAKVIGKVAQNVVFVIKRKQFIIYSCHVPCYIDLSHNSRYFQFIYIANWLGGIHHNMKGQNRVGVCVFFG